MIPPYVWPLDVEFRGAFCGVCHFRVFFFVAGLVYSRSHIHFLTHVGLLSRSEDKHYWTSSWIACFPRSAVVER